MTCCSNFIFLGQSIFWFIIRGLEAHAVMLGDLELPANARLALYRVPPTDLQNLELITLANVSKGKVVIKVSKMLVMLCV